MAAAISRAILPESRRAVEKRIGASRIAGNAVNSPEFSR
jgi:hypothetical protein